MRPLMLVAALTLALSSACDDAGEAGGFAGTGVGAAGAGGLGGLGGAGGGAGEGLGGTGGPAIAGTCAAPLPLSTGTFLGSTAEGADEALGHCVSTEEAVGGREIVFGFVTQARARLVASLVNDGTVHDTVLFLRDRCDAEVDLACNDDAHGGGTRSAIDLELAPGSYLLFVDGYGPSAGEFQLDVRLTSVLALGERCEPDSPVAACGRGLACTEGACRPQGGNSCELPRTLAFETTEVLDTRDFADHATPPPGCAGRPPENAPDVIYTFTLDAPADVTVTTAHDGTLVRDTLLYARTACNEESTLACNDDLSFRDSRSQLVLEELEAGSYFVFVDGFSSDDAGLVEISAARVEVIELGAPCDPDSATAHCRRGFSCEDGACVALSGEQCETPLVLEEGSNEDDLTRRRDDYASPCFDSTGPDALWSFTLTETSDVRITATGVVGLFFVDACKGVSTPKSCSTAEGGRNPSATIAATSLPPGTYYVAVDAVSLRRATPYRITRTTTPVLSEGDRCGEGLPRCPDSQSCVQGPSSAKCKPLAPIDARLFVSHVEAAGTGAVLELAPATGEALGTEFAVPQDVVFSPYAGLATDGAELFFVDGLYAFYGAGGTSDLLVFDAVSGALLRRMPTPMPGMAALALAVDETHLYAIYTDGPSLFLAKADKLTGALVSQGSVSDDADLLLDMDGGLLFAGSSSAVGELSLEGALTRKTELPDVTFRAGGLGAAAGLLFVGDAIGNVTLLSAADFTYVSHVPAGLGAITGVAAWALTATP